MNDERPPDDPTVRRAGPGTGPGSQPGVGPVAERAAEPGAGAGADERAEPGPPPRPIGAIAITGFLTLTILVLWFAMYTLNVARS